MTLDITSVAKHPAAINVERMTTYSQQLTWNVLLANAMKLQIQNGEQIKNRYEISISNLCEFLGLHNKNKKHLWDSLDTLIKTTVRWDILKKDKKRKWGKATLLAGYEVDGDTMTYSYYETVVEQLLNPEIFVRVNLLMQKDFNSKYAIPIYEECVNALVTCSSLFRYKYGETNWIDLKLFRQWMGVKEGQYLEFKYFNKRVIKEAVAEINSKTDLSVEVEFRRIKRQVAGLRFKVTLSSHPERLSSVPSRVVKQLENITLADELRKYGLDPERVSKQLIEKPEYVQFCVELLEWNKNRGEKTKSGDAAWLYSAITAEVEYNKPKGFTTKIERNKLKQKREADQRKKLEIEREEDKEIAQQREYA